MDELSLGGQKIEAGEKSVVGIHVTSDLAMPLDIHAHVVAGGSPGPTLLLLSMLHGNEWFSVVILRDLLKQIEPGSLSGNIIGIPVANPSAFLTGTRCIMDDSDEPDANRTFGGIYDWISNQLTRTIERELFPQTDFLIDYHVSDWGSTMADIGYTDDPANAALSKKSMEMALAYGYPALHVHRFRSDRGHTGLRGARTALGFAGERYSIPGIVSGVGGLGWGRAVESEWLALNVKGTLGVMKYLGMLEGEPEYCDRYFCIEDYWRVSPKVGGYLEPAVGLDRQFTEVQEGELLGTVTSPTTFEILEELRSPGRGTIFYACRSYMVRPGAWAFGVADRRNSEWRADLIKE